MEDITLLKEKFIKVIAFSEEDINNVVSKLKSSLSKRFLKRGFAPDFVQNKLKLWWNVQGDFFVLPLSEKVLLFKITL